MTTHSPVSPLSTTSPARRRLRQWVRRALEAARVGSRTRDIVTILGGYVLVVGLSLALFAVWAVVAALVAGAFAVGAIAP